MPPKRISRLNVKVVGQMLIRTYGNVSAAAKRLGIARSRLYEFIKQNPELRTTLNDSRETLLDYSEAALSAAVLKGEPWAITLTLKTLGKSRGYVERQEVASAPRTRMPGVVVVLPPNGRDVD